MTEQELAAKAAGEAEDAVENRWAHFRRLFVKQDVPAQQLADLKLAYVCGLIDGGLLAQAAMAMITDVMENATKKASELAKPEAKEREVAKVH